jgi:hypothetical protein
MSDKPKTLREFIEKLNSDPGYMAELFKADDPAKFLEDEAGITVRPDRRQELNELISDLWKGFPGKKLRFAASSGETGGGIEVDIGIYF